MKSPSALYSFLLGSLGSSHISKLEEIPIGMGEIGGGPGGESEVDGMGTSHPSRYVPQAP